MNTFCLVKMGPQETMEKNHLRPLRRGRERRKIIVVIIIYRRTSQTGCLEGNGFASEIVGTAVLLISYGLANPIWCFTLLTTLPDMKYSLSVDSKWPHVVSTILCLI